MSSANHRFCAVESIRAGDPLPGTATHAARNLLIGWPRAKWSRSLRIAKDMDEGLARQIDQLAADGRRVNLIDRKGMPPEVHRVYLFPEQRYFDIPRPELEHFVTALAEGSDLSSWSDRPADKPLVLCCTHGKKDKCCAKFGYAAYRQLARTTQQEGLDFDVWESSHLGGCRLAASMLMLPSMRKYGRIAPEHVLPLLQQESQDRPYLPCYRGNGLMTPAQQCAEAAALDWLDERGIAARLAVMPEQTTDTMGEACIPVKWHSNEEESGGSEVRSGVLAVRCRTIEVVRLDTCADLEEGPTPSKCWVANDIRPH